MPAYLVVLQGDTVRGDMLIQDDTLTLDVRGEWALFTDSTGLALALPAGRVAYIERTDDTTIDGPAPEGDRHGQQDQQQDHRQG